MSLPIVLSVFFVCDRRYHACLRDPVECGGQLHPITHRHCLAFRHRQQRYAKVALPRSLCGPGIRNKWESLRFKSQLRHTSGFF